MRTILHYPLSDHHSTHSSHIAVTYSIIDFQRIFLLLIGGNRFPRCGSAPPIAKFANMPMAIYAPMGLVVSNCQRSGRAASHATRILSQMLKLPYDPGENVEWQRVGVPLCSPSNIDPSRKPLLTNRSNASNSRDNGVSGALRVGGR